MDIEYLSAIWQRDDGGNRYSITAEDLNESLHRSATRFERKLQLRDWIELVGGFLGGGFFIVIAVSIFPNAHGTVWIDHWDWLLLGFACWVIGAVFVRERIRARKNAPRADDDICTTLQRQNESLRHQIGLLKRVAWWYVLPFALPLAIVTWRSFPPEWKLPYSVGCVVLFGGIIVLNRWYAKRRLLPQLEANEQLLKEAS